MTDEKDLGTYYIFNFSRKKLRKINCNSDPDPHQNAVNPKRWTKESFQTYFRKMLYIPA